MDYEIPYKRTPEPERAKASGPVDFEKLGEVIDGYEPDWRPIRAGEDVTKLNASLAERDALIKRMEAQLRFQHEVLAAIHELTGDDMGAAPQWREVIRIKAQVALRAASKSGLLT